MAVSLVQSKTFTGTGTSSGGSFGVAPSSGNLVTFGAKSGSGTTVVHTAADNNSGTFTKTPDGDVTLDVSNTMAVLYLANAAVTPNANPTYTLTATNNGTSSLRSILEEVSGCATSSPLNDHGSGGSSTAATSGSAVTAGATTNSGDYVLGVTTINAAETTDTKGASYAVGSDILVGRLATEWKAATAGGSQTADYSWTATAAGWMAIIATFKAAGGAPPAAVQPPMRTLTGAGI